MDISVRELEKIRLDLEKDYDEIEGLINGTSNDKTITELDDKLLFIDKQLDLLDEIISNLKRTPKLYESYLKMAEEYKKM